jgi:NitT/TauT family transport system substrate-binding protein
MPITIYESFRAVFYTPFYLPHALGAYEAEGLDVQLGTSPSLEDVGAHMRDGQADVYWGGPMRIMVNHDRDPNCGIVGFCEAVTRDPFFLLGREPKPDFQLADLSAVSLGSVSEVPTPWMCLQNDLRRAGLDPAALTRTDDASMADNAAALRAKSIDVAQLFEPFVETLLSEGAAHIWYAAASRGPCSYTTLYCLRETVDKQADALHRMTRAMYRAQKWLHANDGHTVATAIAAFFPEHSIELLAAAIDRYKALGVWGKNPRLPLAGFERLREGLLSGGLIEKEIAYQDCVDMQFADAVIDEDPPSI